MTIINPNSISGISSITALNSTAAINLFKADGTSANIIAGVTTGSNFITGTSNVHSTGYECTNINASGIITATTFVGNGDFVELDVDGHTNLDNVSIAGVTTFSDRAYLTHDLTITGTAPRVIFTDTDNNPDYRINVDGGSFYIQDTTNGNANRIVINNVGNVTVPGNFDTVGNIAGYGNFQLTSSCLLYTSPSPRDEKVSRMPSSA